MANELYRPTAYEIEEILEKHKHWLNEDCEGWSGMCANLSYADLRYADLRSADLRYADLSYADLSYANLRCADLSSADLSYADLSYANLRYADLSYANLRSADLRSANLSYADLSYANLRSANLSYAKGITMACPSDGAFVGWKKAITEKGFAIVKLEIPDGAKRSSATGRKCRCELAFVIAIYDEDGNEIESAISDNDRSFVYRTGEMVTPDSFDDNRWNECSHGIHFFITRAEAEEYEL